MSTTVSTFGVCKTDEVPARRGAQILLELLESEGVEYIFGNPGSSLILQDAPDLGEQAVQQLGLPPVMRAMDAMA